MVALSGILVSACGGRGGPAPAPSGGLTVTPSDGQVIVSWNPDPGVEYWLWYVAGTSISSDVPTSTPGHRSIIRVASPYVLTGLTNGTTYAFTLNGRFDGGPGGGGTPSVTAVPRPAGTTWVAGGAMGAADMRGLAFGAATDGTAYLVAAGGTGAIYRSTFGITTSALSWTLVPAGIAGNLNAAVYAFSKFIAVGDTGGVYYSADAQTWSAGTSATGQNLNAVSTNGSLAVAVGNAGVIQYSTDGVTWTAAASVPATVFNLLGVAYNNGTWFAVGTHGTIFASADGSNWSTVTSGTILDLNGSAFRAATTSTAGTFAAAYVVVGQGVILTSVDGATWTIPPGSPASNFSAVSPVASQFLAVGAGGVVYTSPDGLTWTSRTSGTGVNLLGLINYQTQYVAVGQSGLSIYSR
jgi:hypothetical protein